MGFSRQARIITLLVIDTAFFFLELIVGYAVGSLALVADSFHMLNDVLSLYVALYTIKLATSPSSAANSYGWQRAEILGALINGVFLVALCMTIALEAVGRIVSPPEISSPKLIVIVGSLGLLSNIVGLFLFHEHGHGGHSHSHSEGAIALPPDSTDEPTPNPQRQRADSMSSLFQHPAQTRAQVIETAQEYGYGRPLVDETSNFMGAMSPPSHHRGASVSRNTRKKGSISAKNTRSRQAPAVGTDDVRSPVGMSPTDEYPNQSTGGSGNGTIGENGVKGHDHAHKHNHMAADVSSAEAGHAADGHGHGHGHGHDHSHEGHGHEHGAGGGGGGHGGHGHSHGSMNMRGVFLHVLGDALGNVGVIAAGLVIWFFEGRWTLYFDPGISLFITCIIFSSAVPLVKSASYILMQGVPSHVSLEAVRSGIKSVPGVVSVHELHIWQLSESTVVASVHVMITPGAEYMEVANGIRGVMHSHGIHSVTIQPEFHDDAASIAEETACLIRCPPEQCGTDTCCPPVAGSKNGQLINVEEGEEHDHASHAH